jgi:hypothetical protein
MGGIQGLTAIVRRYEKHYVLTNMDRPPAEGNFCDENKKTRLGEMLVKT